MKRLTLSLQASVSSLVVLWSLLTPAGLLAAETGAETDAPVKAQMIAFRSEWCPPCKKLTPAIARVKKHYSERIDVFEVDVNKQENRDLMVKYHVTVVPTIVFISDNGTTIHICPGLSADMLSQGVKSLLKRSPRQIGYR